MHTKEELDRAILNLYKDYKDTIKNYKDSNLKFLYDVNKINNEEKKYTGEEACYICLNALALLEHDMINNNL
mgnify:CR=1 FL=1